MQEYQFNSKEYNKKIYNRASGGSFAVIIFFIIILVGVAFMLIRQNKPSKNEFYFVEINQFLTYKEAGNLSEEIQSKSGAGYVFFDGQYHVFANFYLSKTDAESVCENLKQQYPTCKVFTLSYNKYSKNKKLSSTENSACKKLYEVGQTSIEQLYNNIYQFGTAQINENQLKANFSSVADKFTDVYNEFISVFNSNSKFNKAKSYLSELYFSLGTLKNITNETDFNFKMRYELVKFVVNFTNTISCF